MDTSDRSVATRWSPRLAAKFCAISSYFLANYHRLRPHDGAAGLTSTEALSIIHLMDFKWDARHPFPTVGLLATRMGLKERSVRDAMRRLEQLGLVKRIAAPHGGPNRYDLSGLIAALEALMDSDIAAEDAEAGTGAETDAPDAEGVAA